MRLITDPSLLPRWSAPYRLWQGIPSLERTRGGRLFSCFYSGNIIETVGNYCLVLCSDDNGKTWRDPVAVLTGEWESEAAATERFFDPNLWIDPLGRLWFTWSRMPDRALHGVICADPDAETLVWSDIFFIGNNVMMCKPLVTSWGVWLFPISVWPNHGTPTCPTGAHVYETTDEGKTFTRLGAAVAPQRTFDEHMVFERRDGSLMMLMRTPRGIDCSVSSDRGATWSLPEQYPMPAPCSRFFIRRLRSGRLLFVNNDDARQRRNMTAFLSEDDGATWKYRILLDPRANVSYPDGAEADDGSIWLTWDHERGSYRKTREESLSDAREILLSRITEEDVMAGKLVDPASFTGRIISRLGAYEGEDFWHTNE